MQNRLKEMLWAYIVHNNPDLMFSLQEDYSVTTYLEEKVAAAMPLAESLLAQNRPVYAVEELCLNAMTAELKPSKFLYLRSVIEEEFPDEYKAMRENGKVTHEVIKLITACSEVFESFGFTKDNEDNSQLRHALIVAIHDYFL